ncbi:hypothetical protein D3C81_1069330 [compost metagenome]
MGVSIKQYKVCHIIEEGSKFRVGPSYGFDHVDGIIEIDYVGLISQDILDSPTDVEVYLDGQDNPEEVIWVGYRYTHTSHPADRDDYVGMNTMYCPAYAIENNIRGL